MVYLNHVNIYEVEIKIKLFKKFGFLHSIDLSVMLQGKFQVGVSSTAENAAARKAFLVRQNV